MGEETKTNLKTSQNFQYKLEFHLAVRNFLITRGCGGNRADKKTQEERVVVYPKCRMNHYGDRNYCKYFLLQNSILSSIIQIYKHTLKETYKKSLEISS